MPAGCQQVPNILYSQIDFPICCTNPVPEHQPIFVTMTELILPQHARLLVESGNRFIVPDLLVLLERNRPDHLLNREPFGNHRSFRSRFGLSPQETGDAERATQSPILQGSGVFDIGHRDLRHLNTDPTPGEIELKIWNFVGDVRQPQRELQPRCSRQSTQQVRYLNLLIKPILVRPAEKLRAYGKELTL